MDRSGIVIAEEAKMKREQNPKKSNNTDMDDKDKFSTRRTERSRR